MYSNNPNYQLIFQHNQYSIFQLKEEYITNLHKSREVEAKIQNIYSNAGATAEYIQQLTDAGIKMLENDPKSDQLRQNMLAILQQLNYRTKYPVDSLCGIRMGAILSFMEITGKDGTINCEPEDAQIAWIDRKVQLALELPELYTFFLHLGIASTPAYYNHLDTLKDQDYFHRRTEMLTSFNPLLKK